MIFQFFGAMLSHFFCFVLGIGGEQSFPPPLPAREERALFLQKQTGDEQARARLIEHNLRLVAHIVRKYYVAHPSQDDLVSIGSLGLIKAVDSFDVKNGARFATYAAKCIQNEILMFFRSQKKYGAEEANKLFGLNLSAKLNYNEGSLNNAEQINADRIV